MGLGTGLMKSLMFVFNGIVWVLGLVLFVVGIVVLIEGENWNEIIDGKTVPVSVLLIIVGLVIAIVGFLGCFGAMKQNSGMLLVYAIVLGVVILVQLVAGILAFIYSDEGIKNGHNGFLTAMARYNTSDSSTTRGINWLQKHLDCCGIQNSADWRIEANKAKIWIQSHINDVPDSCCKRLTNQWNPTPGCGLGQALGNSDAIHNGGCYVNMVEWMQTYMPMMGVFCLVFMVFEMAVIVIVFVMRNQAEELSHPVRLN